MKLKYFSLVISIAGIFILYFLSKFSQAPLIKINELPNYNGKQVTIEGIVIEHQLTKYGSQIITIENENSITSIFSEKKVEIEFGDKIQVTGEVQKYKEKWELIVNDISNLKILEKSKNLSFPLWQLAENPQKYLNKNINVTGYIESISNSYFCLVDLEKKFFLTVVYQLEKNIAIIPGQKVSIFGCFSFDEKNFRYILEINQETHCIYPLKEK